eukprot:211805_1
MWTRCMHPYRMAPNVSLLRLLYHSIHMDPSVKRFLSCIHCIQQSSRPSACLWWQSIHSTIHITYHPSDAPTKHAPTTAAPTTHPSETPTATRAPTQSPVTRSPTRTGQTYPPTTQKQD